MHVCMGPCVWRERGWEGGREEQGKRYDQSGSKVVGELQAVTLKLGK